MQRFAVANETKGVELAATAELANGFWSRLRGLLGRAELPVGQALWIDPCNSIHTFFMRFPIDAIFLDAGLRVVRVSPNLGPGRLTRVYWKAVSCLELPGGAVAPSGTSPGDQLRFKPIVLPTEKRA